MAWSAGHNQFEEACWKSGRRRDIAIGEAIAEVEVLRKRVEGNKGEEWAEQ
eukprot:CAMPEP_0170087026 /NCGR_PEP_ID=MMETSP0019_2-20121128/21594_1 /TAXON_ID=98059 /ORGANISM="Dinobryon sp., Strain UTEXLB2267" /LENGTH=50 /DNA_ID=CAMNT_0010304445 /DNA_START=368 /DNA_END=518 /DNA_ORIENTATION=+